MANRYLIIHPICHPERKHKAHGLCEKCYENSGRRNRNKAKALCHPERAHQAHGMCKTCYNKEYLKTYKQSSEVRARKKEGGWRKRGIIFTVEKYNQFYEGQGGLCAICHSKTEGSHGKLVVDHDHETGLVRGLLCDYCNRRLLIKRNTLEILQSAVDYLKSFKNKKLNKIA